MTDLEPLFRTLDDLKPDELEQVRVYIENKRTYQVAWWIIPPEALAKIDEIMRPVQEEAATMSEEEVNAAIDEAIAEVRQERRERLKREQS